MMSMVTLIKKLELNKKKSSGGKQTLYILDEIKIQVPL